jgi:hypothetical protein
VPASAADPAAPGRRSAAVSLYVAGFTTAFGAHSIAANLGGYAGPARAAAGAGRAAGGNFHLTYGGGSTSWGDANRRLSPQRPLLGTGGGESRPPDGVGGRLSFSTAFLTRVQERGSFTRADSRRGWRLLAARAIRVGRWW